MLCETARISFQKGKQMKFLKDAKLKLGLEWKELAAKLDINSGTLHSYYYGYSSLPFTVVANVCGLCGWKMDDVREKYLTAEFETAENKIVGKKGYGFGEGRRKLPEVPAREEAKIELNLAEFMELRAAKKTNFIPPKFLDENLAEEMGIHLGDGFLSDVKKEFRVKGDRNNERKYYDQHLKRLYKTLFNIDIKNRDYKTSYGFEIYSKELWLFKTGALGIPPGKKDAIRIPKSVRVSNAGIWRAFLRGLMDTDGCLEFKSRYGYVKYYPVISWSAKSPYLAKDVFVLFKRLGFAPKLYKKRDSYEICLYGYAKFRKYMQMIGWNNEKHLEKAREFEKIWPNLAKVQGA